MSGSKEIFRRRLKIARKSAGLTQATLAEAIDKSEDTVSSWERGKREIQMDDLDLVARACGYPPPWFITEEEEQEEAELDGAIEAILEAHKKLGQEIASLKATQPQSLRVRSSSQPNQTEEWSERRTSKSRDSTESGDP